MANFAVTVHAGTVLTPALGVVVDTVGYGRRNTSEQREVQERVSAMTGQVLADTGISPEELLFTETSGDGISFFLPPASDLGGALLRMLSATAARLTESNARYRDRIRMRMAVGFGLVGRGPLGVTGHLIVELNRLAESPQCRNAVIDRPAEDLVVLISDVLHRIVAPDGELLAFERVEVSMKEYNAPAWMWIVPTPSA